MQTLEQLRSGQLTGSTQLKLSCNLTTFPTEIFSLADTLETLDLSGNGLSDLPPDFSKLRKLRIAFFSDNQFERIPEVLGSCPGLEMIGFKANRLSHISEQALPATTRWLILTNNKLTRLPGSIGKCVPLQKVGLAGNLLTELPEEMAACKNLELLRISANRLSGLPSWLFQLPRLTWLAFAGNPFCRSAGPASKIKEISWSEFELLEKLGEGASGQIYKAHWKQQRREVAIKIFKGEVTSDGLPEDEMNACIAAGSHPNLVSVIGKISHHPETKQALIMELIPSSFYNLGLPPSFATCTRDVFPDNTSFPASNILDIARGIASAAKQLHGRHILHGDLYAHNILIDSKGNSLIGDFGAASLYEGNPFSKELQQLETRAFGCLLDDLLMHLDKENTFNELTAMLSQLRHDCMRPSVYERPLFQEIVKTLGRS